MASEGLGAFFACVGLWRFMTIDRKSTRLNSSHSQISYAVFCLKKKNAKMILVGEPHPEFPVHSLIATLDLQAHVRVLGFTPIEEFVEYMGACDVVLNLRYPTVV